MGDLGSSTWPDIASAGRTYLVVPLGSTEQHGPHLPLSTDTVIAVALAEALASVRADVLVTGPIAISASGEHAGFPGTLSIGSEVLERLLVELVRSADWAAGVVLVNGHGGNAPALAAAIATLRYEQRNVLAWWPAPPEGERGDAHAGWLETSVMLHLAPHLVRPERLERGVTRPLAELMDGLREHGVLGVSPNGVLGDPTAASAADGRTVFDSWVADLVARFEAWAR